MDGMKQCPLSHPGLADMYVVEPDKMKRNSVPSAFLGHLG